MIVSGRLLRKCRVGGSTINWFMLVLMREKWKIWIVPHVGVGDLSGFDEEKVENMDRAACRRGRP